MKYTTDISQENTIKREMIKLNKMLKEFKEKEKKKFRGMFSSTAAASPSADEPNETIEGDDKQRAYEGPTAS
jgi:hypothetical protein